MCGRYGRRADKQRIAAAMHAGYTNVFEEIPPSFNVAPQTFQPVVRLSRDSGERELALMRWGLRFAKHSSDDDVSSRPTGSTSGCGSIRRPNSRSQLR